MIPEALFLGDQSRLGEYANVGRERGRDGRTQALDVDARADAQQPDGHHVIAPGQAAKVGEDVGQAGVAHDEGAVALEVGAEVERPDDVNRLSRQLRDDPGPERSQSLGPREGISHRPAGASPILAPIDQFREVQRIRAGGYATTRIGLGRPLSGSRQNDRRVSIAIGTPDATSGNALACSIRRFGNP